MGTLFKRAYLGMGRHAEVRFLLRSKAETRRRRVGSHHLNSAEPPLQRSAR